MTKLGKIAVMDAVDFNNQYGSKLRYQILHRFDARAFESEKPIPKPEIMTKKQPATKKQPKEINPKQQLEKGQRVRVDGLMSIRGKTLIGIVPLARRYFGIGVWIVVVCVLRAHCYMHIYI